jgi:stearoyl-CoA desaturase (delta-9 desaturase)
MTATASHAARVKDSIALDLSSTQPFNAPALAATQEPTEAVHAAAKEVSLKIRLINLAAVLLPLAGLVAGIALLWGVAFSWVYLGLLVGMYAATAVGITVGYHRLFTHRSFQTGPAVTHVLGALGSMAVEGPVIEWSAVHRSHHQHSDDHGDPHSPNTHGSSMLGVLRGLWHAHVGWMFAREAEDTSRYVKDLTKDPVVRHIDRLFVFWVVVGLLIPTALGGLLTWSWMGMLLGFIWGGLVRVLLVHHVTWSINSVCHIWGTRPFRSHDLSRNNAIFGFLGFGEGWHNNHHAFPTSARHGLRWWELDLAYLFIRGLAVLGLAKNVRRPSPERMAAQRMDFPRR